MMWLQRERGRTRKEGKEMKEKNGNITKKRERCEWKRLERSNVGEAAEREDGK